MHLAGFEFPQLLFGVLQRVSIVGVVSIGQQSALGVSHVAVNIGAVAEVINQIAVDICILVLFCIVLDALTHGSQVVLLFLGQGETFLFGQITQHIGALDAIFSHAQEIVSPGDLLFLVVILFIQGLLGVDHAQVKNVVVILAIELVYDLGIVVVQFHGVQLVITNGQCNGVLQLFAFCGGINGGCGGAASGGTVCRRIVLADGVYNCDGGKYHQCNSQNSGDDHHNGVLALCGCVLFLGILLAHEFSSCVLLLHNRYTITPEKKKIKLIFSKFFKKGRPFGLPSMMIKRGSFPYRRTSRKC